MENKTDLQQALETYLSCGGSLSDCLITKRHIVEGIHYTRHSIGDICDRYEAYTNWDDAVLAANAISQEILDNLDQPLCDNCFSVKVMRDMLVIVIPDSEDINLPHIASDADGTMYHYGFDYSCRESLVVSYQYDELGQELPDMSLRDDPHMWIYAF